MVNFLVVLAVFGFIFLPSIIAFAKKHNRAVLVLVANFVLFVPFITAIVNQNFPLLGVSFLAWCGVLIWGFIKNGENIKNLDPKVKQSLLYNILIGVGLFIAIIAALANIKVTPYVIYKDATYHFHIKYPKNWKMIEKPEGGSIVAFVAPKDNSADYFAENFNIVVQDLSLHPMALNQFSNTAIKQLTGTLGNFVEVVESRPTRLSGREAYRFVYAGMRMEKVPKPIQYYHVWIVDGNTAYILTFAGLKDDFHLYKDKLNAMLGSFKLE